MSLIKSVVGPEEVELFAIECPLFTLQHLQLLINSHQTWSNNTGP